MLVHAQPLLDVSLRQPGARLADLVRTRLQAAQRGLREAEGPMLSGRTVAHSAQRSTTDHIVLRARQRHVAVDKIFP
jgi:hypothetical protein